MVIKRHFETFDALRFLAFFKVFLYHLPLSHWPWFNYMRAGGDIGVRLFYVLSGFLITYIILEEKQQTGRLNFRHFMLRRILRIWPLYYLMMAFAYLTPLILSHLGISHSDDGYVPQLFFSLTFLENYKAIITHQGANVSPLPVMWSVCVEEHFYLVWGLLLCLMSVRHIPKIAVVCTIVALISRTLFVILGYNRLDLFTNFDFFAIGALPAYFLITRPATFEITINRIDKSVKIGYVLLVIAAVQIIPHFRGRVGDLCACIGRGLIHSSVVDLPSAEDRPSGWAMATC